MLLDYERYQVKSKKRHKGRVVVLLLCLVVLGVGGYFLVSEVIIKIPFFQTLFFPAPAPDIDGLWTRFVVLKSGTGEEKPPTEDELKLLNEVLARSEESLATHPLDLRSLVYHGYGLFYRASYETTFENKLSFYNQSLVSLRRALVVANDEIKPQIFYMLGKIYFYKRDFYYDLAERYLEQALDLGYKRLDAYEYLVLIQNAWGNTEQAIVFLERAYDEKKSDLYLYHLAKNYQKANRSEEASNILDDLCTRVKDSALLIECRFLLAEIYFDQGDIAAAETQYRDILEMDMNRAEAHFRLALLYEKKGDYVQYRYELRRTLDNDPGHSGARSRL